MAPPPPTEPTTLTVPWAAEVEALWTRVTGGELGLDIRGIEDPAGRSYEAQSRSGRLTVSATDAGAP